ncbi:hypothetical protein D3C80_1149210 [compost metagenome]
MMKVINSAPPSMSSSPFRIMVPPNQTRQIITVAPRNSFSKGDKSPRLKVPVFNCWSLKFTFLKRSTTKGIALNALMTLIPPIDSSRIEKTRLVCSCPALAVRFKLFPIREITNAEIGRSTNEIKVNFGLMYTNEATETMMAKGSLKTNSKTAITASSISLTSLLIRAIKSPFRCSV